MATKKSNQAAPEGAGQNIQEQTAASAAEQEKASAAATREAELQSLDELALLFRVPTWQQAALTRLMGWAPDKSVSEADYADALDSLNSRRMGSGRKE